jgi:hypothetical protein
MIAPPQAGLLKFRTGTLFETTYPEQGDKYMDGALAIFT